MPADPSEPGLRDRKKEETRRALREGAARLFAERGFAGTTIEDVAARANVSRRTFFRYFDSKEALLLPDLDDLFDLVEAALARQPAAVEPLAAVCAALREAAGPFAASSLTALTHPFEGTEGLVAARLTFAFTHFEERLSLLVRARMRDGGPSADRGADPDADLDAAVIAGAALAAVRAVLRTLRRRRREGVEVGDPGQLLTRSFEALTRIGTAGSQDVRP